MDKYIIERRARIRLAWFQRFEQIGNISQVCREFAISRKTFYKWCPIYAREGLPGLRDRSKRPRSYPKTVPREIAQLILKLRHKSRYGPRRLAFYLERDYGVKLSVYGIYRVLVRAGETKPLALICPLQIRLAGKSRCLRQCRLHFILSSKHIPLLLQAEGYR